MAGCVGAAARWISRFLLVVTCFRGVWFPDSADATSSVQCLGSAQFVAGVRLASSLSGGSIYFLVEVLGAVGKV